MSVWVLAVVVGSVIAAVPWIGVGRPDGRAEWVAGSAFLALCLAATIGLATLGA